VGKGSRELDEVSGGDIGDSGIGLMRNGSWGLVIVRRMLSRS